MGPSLYDPSGWTVPGARRISFPQEASQLKQKNVLKKEVQVLTCATRRPKWWSLKGKFARVGVCSSHGGTMNLC
jgi:hypothetical protein